MRRMMPTAAVCMVVLVGCAGDPPSKPIDPGLHQVTLEVKGMT